MNRWLKRANTKLSIGWTAALLFSMSLGSMFLSLFRERLLNANFGVASLDLDAYRVAFKVPDFMFIVLVSGALSVTFIPVLTERLGKGNKKSAWDMSSSLLNFLAMLTLAASVFIMIFADPIVEYLLAPGMSPEGQDLATVMMRIIAINPFLFSISAVLTSVQQAVGRFFFFAIAPLTYSIGIIFGILFLAPTYGIIGVSIGVVIGSVLQLTVAVVGMIGLGFQYAMRVNWNNLGFRKVLQLLPYRSVDQGMDYITNLVEISIASRLRQGAINAWEVAFMIHWVPINLLGVAISTAAFPQMSERINQGRPDLFKKEFITVLRVLIWLTIPAVIITYFGRGFLVRLLVAEGNTVIADLLGLLVVAIFFRAIFHLVSRGFYAQQDTKTPLFVSLFAITLNIILAIYLVTSWGLGLGIYGLAIAQSLVAGLEVIILMVILENRFPGLLNKSFWRAMIKMSVAGVVTGVVAYFMIRIFPLRVSDVGFFTLVPKFVLTVSVSLLTYLMVSYGLKLREAQPVVKKITSLVYNPVKIQ